MKILSILMILAISHQALAQNCSSFLNSSSPESLVYENQNQITYTKTEVFNQNNDLGIQQFGKLTFKAWHDLSFEIDPSGEQTSLIGLTKEGRVYHLVRSGDRTLARKLSGKKTFERLQVTTKGLILGVRTDGSTEVFSPKVWSEPARKKAIKQFKKLWALSASIGLAGVQFFPELNMPVDLKLFSFNFPMYEMIFTVASGLSAAFPAVAKLDSLNRNPDGFVKSDLDFSDPDWFLNVENDTSDLRHFELPNFDELAPKLAEEFTQEID